jgi:hypothetical protein
VGKEKGGELRVRKEKRGRVKGAKRKKGRVNGEKGGGSRGVFKGGKGGVQGWERGCSRVGKGVFKGGKWEG